MNVLMLKTDLMLLISWLQIFFGITEKMPCCLALQQGDMIMLIQYRYLIPFQNSENDFLSPLKNTMISKTKYDFKQSVPIPGDPMTAMVLIHEILASPMYKGYRLSFPSLAKMFN